MVILGNSRGSSSHCVPSVYQQWLMANIQKYFDFTLRSSLPILSRVVNNMDRIYANRFLIRLRLRNKHIREWNYIKYDAPQWEHCTQIQETWPYTD